ncbi:DUF6232 family protein [Micromonospora sp. NBC_01699]|uniref:DUF6232 family protein n=1 Tax=Micromonospora sp. NBC_01699 TaxID=2975984 RepID=UPI002E2E386E|nr:DUF6232 family protein [Micromonospora sp. NBC_01699]
MHPTRDSARRTGAQSVTERRAGRPAPVEFYRQPGVQVTSESFTVAGHRFPVAELTQLRTARGPHDPLTVRTVVVTGAVLVVIGVAFGYTGEFYRLDAATYLALGAAAFLPVVLAFLGHRLRPPTHELWGRYRGEMMLLFSSDQERQFGQLTRALRRAQEVARSGGVADPLVTLSPPWEPPAR